VLKITNLLIGFTDTAIRTANCKGLKLQYNVKKVRYWNDNIMSTQSGTEITI
jgi:hypothetical protein